MTKTSDHDAFDKDTPGRARAKRSPGAAAAIALAAGATLGACASVPRTADVSDRVTLLSDGLELRTPETGEAPFPTVVFFHGCGGLYTEEGDRKTVMDEYAAAALQEGVAVLIVDSLSPRGITYRGALRQVCSGLRLRGRDRAYDVEAALAFARAQPSVDADRLALAGWSHGGWAVMESLIMFDAVEPAAPARLDGVAAVHLTYPYCGFLTRAHEHAWGGERPVRLVLAGADTLSKNDRCEAAIDQARADGAIVSQVVFNGATHAFDEAEHVETSTFVYQPEKAVQAHALFADWLSAALVPVDEDRHATATATAASDGERGIDPRLTMDLVIE